MARQLAASYRASLETQFNQAVKMERENHTHTQGRRQGLTPNFQSCADISCGMPVLSRTKAQTWASSIHFMHTYVQKYYKDFLKESAKRLYD